jgi:RsiW-degrading membrane proteinase PrsW (M82 family)
MGGHMSRLYYEKSVDAPDVRAGNGGGAKEYLEKVTKLIPSEIVAGYIALIGFVPMIRLIPEDKHFWVYIGVFIACVILTIWYMNYQSEENKPKTVHIIVSTCAFIIWAYTISGNIVWPEIHDPAIASIILIIFSLISGKIPLS